MALQIAAVKLFWEDTAIAASSQTRVQTLINNRAAAIGTLSADQVVARMRYNFATSRAVGGVLYYLHDEASDIAGYRKLLTTSADTTEKSLERNLSDAETLPITKVYDEWVVEPDFASSYPQVVTGTWTCYIRCQVTDDDLNTSIRVRFPIYLRTWDEDLSSFVETLLATPEVTPSTTKFTRTVSFSITATLKTVAGNNDRIVIKPSVFFDEIPATF